MAKSKEIYKQTFISNCTKIIIENYQMGCGISIFFLFDSVSVIVVVVVEIFWLYLFVERYSDQISCRLTLTFVSFHFCVRWLTFCPRSNLFRQSSNIKTTCCSGTCMLLWQRQQPKNCLFPCVWWWNRVDGIFLFRCFFWQYLQWRRIYILVNQIVEPITILVWYDCDTGEKCLTNTKTKTVEMI